MDFDYLCNFLRESSRFKLFYYSKFFKSKKIILLSFKFENIHVSGNSIDVNIIQQTNDNDHTLMDILINYCKRRK